MIDFPTRDQLHAKIAANLQIDPARLRYVFGRFPGQFGETGGPRWEIHYQDEWRELPWHYDGPTNATREMVRCWYG